VGVKGKLLEEAIDFAVKATTKKAERKSVAAAAKKAVKTAPAILKTGSGKGRDLAADAFKVAGGKKKAYADWVRENGRTGALFDYSGLGKVPDVPQTQMPRYSPKKGTSARMADLLSNPDVEQGVNATVERGLAGGGANWYNTDPLRERMLAIHGEDEGTSRYARLMDLVSATSPRSKVPDNIRTATYYNYLSSNDLPFPDKPAPGYGSVAQNNHRSNALDVTERGGWDVFKNPKPASFSTNLQGNQNNVTIDTHNMRLPAILSRDPRFLATSVKAGTKGDPETAMAALLARYPGLPGEEVSRSVANFKEGAQDLAAYRPQEWVEKGYLSMDDAVKDPVLWDAMPRANEYGPYEAWQQEQAKRLGVSPAQYQAAMWLGGGEDTGLASEAEPWLASMEKRIGYTADLLGMSADEVMEAVLKGKMPLLAKGGRVDAAALAQKYA